jgi:DNA (cytosine-5)-methyltransferase 1
MPLLLDLFCCAGGASTGYARAGFTVVGVDIEPQPRYPFRFVQMNALTALDILLANGYIYVAGFGAVWLEGIDAIAASPPCQGYSVTKSVNKNASSYPLLIPDVRNRLIATGLPYIIENVEGARKEMVNPVTLCGSQFGLRSDFNGENAYLRRHRLFETNWLLPEAGPHDHSGYAFPVFGHGPGGSQNPHLRGKGAAAMARQLMGIDWMRRHELDESIPPVYTEFIGNYALQEIARRNSNTIPLAA